ncbi:MAG: hypothetical protein ACFFC7_30270 [Candidatus Hermodarchaeota archaeon]
MSTGFVTIEDTARKIAKEEVYVQLESVKKLITDLEDKLNSVTEVFSDQAEYIKALIKNEKVLEYDIQKLKEKNDESSKEHINIVQRKYEELNTNLTEKIDVNFQEAQQEIHSLTTKVDYLQTQIKALEKLSASKDIQDDFKQHVEKDLHALKTQITLFTKAQQITETKLGELQKQVEKAQTTTNESLNLIGTLEKTISGLNAAYDVQTKTFQEYQRSKDQKIRELQETISKQEQLQAELLTRLSNIEQRTFHLEKKTGHNYSELKEGKTSSLEEENLEQFRDELKYYIGSSANSYEFTSPSRIIRVLRNVIKNNIPLPSSDRKSILEYKGKVARLLELGNAVIIQYGNVSEATKRIGNATRTIKRFSTVEQINEGLSAALEELNRLEERYLST